VKDKLSESKQVKARGQAERFVAENPEALSEIEKVYAERVEGVTDLKERNRIGAEVLNKFIDVGEFPASGSPFFQTFLNVQIARGKVGDFRRQLDTKLQQLSQIVDEDDNPIEPADLDQVISQVKAPFLQSFAISNSFLGLRAFQEEAAVQEDEFKEQVALRRSAEILALGVSKASQVLISGTEEGGGFPGFEAILTEGLSAPEVLAGADRFLEEYLRGQNIPDLSSLVADSLNQFATNMLEVANSEEDVESIDRLRSLVGQFKVNGVPVEQDRRSKADAGSRVLSSLRTEIERRRRFFQIQGPELALARQERAVDSLKGQLLGEVNAASKQGASTQPVIDAFMNRLRSNEEARDLLDGDDLSRASLGQLDQYAFELGRVRLALDVEIPPPPRALTELLSELRNNRRPLVEIRSAIFNAQEDGEIDSRQAELLLLDNEKKTGNRRQKDSSADYLKTVEQTFSRLKPSKDLSERRSLALQESLDASRLEIDELIDEALEGRPEGDPESLGTLVKGALSGAAVQAEIARSRESVLSANDAVSERRFEVEGLIDARDFEEATKKIAQGDFSVETVDALRDRIDTVRYRDAQALDASYFNQARRTLVAISEVLLSSEEFLQEGPESQLSVLALQSRLEERFAEILEETKGLPDDEKAARRKLAADASPSEILLGTDILSETGRKIVSSKQPELVIKKARLEDSIARARDVVNGSAQLADQRPQHPRVSGEDHSIFSDLVKNGPRIFTFDATAIREAESKAGLAVLGASLENRTDVHGSIFGQWFVSADDVLKGSTTVTSTVSLDGDVAETFRRIGVSPGIAAPFDGIPTELEVSRLLNDLRDRGLEVDTRLVDVLFTKQVRGDVIVSTNVDLFTGKKNYRIDPFLTSFFDSPDMAGRYAADPVLIKRLFERLDLPTEGPDFDRYREEFVKAQSALTYLKKNLP